MISCICSLMLLPKYNVAKSEINAAIYIFILAGDHYFSFSEEGLFAVLFLNHSYKGVKIVNHLLCSWG